MLDKVKCLGVTLDSKLNWNQHLQRTIKKAQTTFAIIRRTCGTKWGLRTNMVQWLYTKVIRPFIFHGALVWWSKVVQKNHQNSIRQDLKNDLPSYYGGYEIDPYSSNVGASESDSVIFADHGGCEAGTLQTEHI
jgi:hypothetical protein